MKNKLIITLFYFSLLIIISCRQPNTNKSQVYTGEIVPINYADTNYIDLQSSTIDTVTTDKWHIKYLIKDDTTRYNDIYIECSKGKYKGLFCGTNLLQFRRYFIPWYIGETETHILFLHGCATDCSAILTCSKDSFCKFCDYRNVVDYSVKYGLILYVPDNAYENVETSYELALVDLRKDSIHKIVYKNICMSVYKPDGVDTVIFSADRVIIKTTLVDMATHMQENKQIKEIIL